MDDKGLGLISIIALAAGGLVVVVAAIGGIMYMSDTAIEATVIDKDCQGSVLGGTDSQITVKTKFPIPGIEHTIKDFDNQLCQALRAGDDGNYARYYLKSERTVLFEREGGQCLYDSDGIKCGAA